MPCVDLINSIILDVKYKDLCKRISNNSSNYEDLYQDFILSILDPNCKERLTKANAENYIGVFCYGIISNIWNKRKLNNGCVNSSSTLYNITDNLNDWNDYIYFLKVSKPDKELINEINTELNRLIKSENKETRRQGILLKEFVNGKNRSEISKELGINYRIVHQDIKEAINKIKSNLNMAQSPTTKTEINITLRNEGCKASYSGKDKTFYVDKMPVEFIIKEVEKAGFKIQISK